MLKLESAALVGSISDGMKCQCKPGCAFTAEAGHPYSLRHDPRPERQEERRAAFAAAGARGNKVRLENRAAKQLASCTLRTVADLFPHLERALVLVVNSGAAAVDKSREIRGIVAAAAELLKVNELAETNRELKELLLEKHPELARHLKAVR